MPDTDALATLEREGWEALSSTGERARSFYDDVLDDDPVMLFPGGMVLTDRATMLDSMSGQPWSSFDLEDVAVRIPAPDTGIVTYGVVATRAGSPPYSALMSSVYVRRDGSWRLALHQQTPRDQGAS